AAAVPARPEGVKRNRSWASLISTAANGARDIAADDLGRLLALSEPSGADLRAFAAYLVWSARRESPPQAIRESLNAVRGFLEKHEGLLPVRAVWLAWVHLAGLTGGDVLALARARDRLLERLFSGGMRPEQDLPGFLRFAGPAASQRFRGVGQWLRNLGEKVRDWIGRQTREADRAPGTAEYSDLLFAFGLARIGERDAALALLQRAKDLLAERDDAHMLLFKGFEYRIRQALEGKPHGGPLPAELLEYLEHMREVRQPNEIPLAYVVDACRRISRVLEPDQQIDPFLYAFKSDEIAIGRAELAGMTDRAELVARVRGLLSKTPKAPAGRRRRVPIYTSALDVAPWVGEVFALEMLTEGAETFDGLIGPADPYDLGNLLPLLERALFVAAHFDADEHVQGLLPRFRQLLEALRNGPGLKDFDRVAGQCFRGLRKLGMRDAVDQLLAQTAEVLRDGRPDGEIIDDAALCSLLHVAGGWLCFGRDRQAEPILQAARALLHANTLPYQRQTALGCACAAAVGQAPPATAQIRLAEIFDLLAENLRDPLTTHPWYSQVQLRVIEAVVLAVVSDDVAPGADARHWLDADEFLVRRRIHAEYRAATARA
ncbi:MAG TPA: hypothetical protein VMS17_23915, partial [Gemmataceae bacterium]|nr:hypothetical protein [Gemmataceae bacterium]